MFLHRVLLMENDKPKLTETNKLFYKFRVFMENKAAYRNRCCQSLLNLLLLVLKAILLTYFIQHKCSFLKDVDLRQLVSWLIGFITVVINMQCIVEALVAQNFRWCYVIKLEVAVAFVIVGRTLFLLNSFDGSLKVKNFLNYEFLWTLITKIKNCCWVMVIEGTAVKKCLKS